jgi:uncharacterized protein YbaP (TraB family)
VVYPEVSKPAPGVVVIHENKGLTDWVRGVADQLAEAGYIAIAPDLLSGTGPGGGGTKEIGGGDAVRQAIQSLPPDQVTKDLGAVAAYVSKLDAAKTFAMEADLDDPEAATMIKETRSSLHQDLGDAYWKKLEDAMGASVAKAVDHLPPMVPASALSMRGLPRTLPMDRTLSERAVSEHKQLVFLEPATRQLAILGKWMDVKALKMLLDELPQSEGHARAMLDAYVAGDEQQIVAISDSEKADALHHGYTAAEYDEEMNEMLYLRNASWIDALEKLHAEGGGFVAVGALHLIGPRSVLDLLAHKGYRVTRVAP